MKTLQHIRLPENLRSGLGMLVPAVALSLCALSAPRSADALTVDVFLIASQSSPAVATTAPLTVTTTKVFQLNLNNNQRATGYTEVNNFSFDIAAPLTFNNQVNPSPNNINDMGEPGAGTAARFNSEVSTWDDVGVVSDGSPDADRNIDFGRNSSVIFNPFAGGFTDLVIAEDAGLTEFDLHLCPDAACTSMQRIFNGINFSTSNALAALPEFLLDDSSTASEMDQAFLFRFSESIFDYVRVTEDDDRNIYKGARLEVDFIGVNAPASVPVPAGLPLLLTGFGLLGWASRRKKA
jgi:hypothetical protein